MAQTKKMETPRWWWFDSQHKGSNRSSWLQSTLSELDDKTKKMLKLIEEDADSFAQRAEMYYKKRPELISLVQDLYRSHRSLAERYDQAKTDTGTRIPGSSFSSSMRSNSDKTINVMEDITNDVHSDTYDSEDNAESEIDDPKHDVVREDEILKLKEEIERLKAENKIQRAQLLQKDTEKIQVIRQLSWSVQELKDDNMELKKIIAKPSTPSRKWGPLEFSRSKGGFLGRLFNGSVISRAAHS